jgi:polyphosphate kinase 2
MEHLLDDIDEMEASAPRPKRLGTRLYEQELHELQIELVKMQRWVVESGEKVVVLFEGRDAAGKGGCIQRLTQHLNPRVATVVALGKPNETERGQWYFQRYVTELPTAGQIALFDRSWYNRAGVEVVMGFCDGHQYREFFRQVPALESALVESGCHLIKLWFCVSREEQARRINSRRTDPLRQWKLSAMDEASMERYDAYSRARNAMLFHTDTPTVPWTVINANEKKRARIEAIRHVLSRLDYDGRDDVVVGRADDQVVRWARDVTKALPPG